MGQGCKLCVFGDLLGWWRIVHGKGRGIVVRDPDRFVTKNLWSEVYDADSVKLRDSGAFAEPSMTLVSVFRDQVVVLLNICVVGQAVSTGG